MTEAKDGQTPIESFRKRYVHLNKDVTWESTIKHAQNVADECGPDRYIQFSRVMRPKGSDYPELYVEWTSRDERYCVRVLHDPETENGNNALVEGDLPHEMMDCFVDGIYGVNNTELISRYA